METRGPVLLPELHTQVSAVRHTSLTPWLIKMVWMNVFEIKSHWHDKCLMLSGQCQPTREKQWQLPLMTYWIVAFIKYQWRCGCIAFVFEHLPHQRQLSGLVSCFQRQKIHFSTTMACKAALQGQCGQVFDQFNRPQQCHQHMHKPSSTNASVFHRHNECMIHDTLVTLQCLPRTTETCHRVALHGLKGIRISMDVANDLLSLDHEIKVIHLIRDPRGLAHSRRTADLLSLVSRMGHGPRCTALLQQSHAWHHSTETAGTQIPEQLSTAHLWGLVQRSCWHCSEYLFIFGSADSNRSQNLAHPQYSCINGQWPVRNHAGELDSHCYAVGNKVVTSVHTSTDRGVPQSHTNYRLQFTIVTERGACHWDFASSQTRHQTICATRARIIVVHDWLIDRCILLANSFHAWKFWLKFFYSLYLLKRTISEIKN